MKAILWILVVIFLIVLGPILTIWAVNVLGETLWPERVLPYTIETWFAVVVIAATLRSSVKVQK